MITPDTHAGRGLAVARLNTELVRIFTSAEAKEKLGPQGFDLAPR